MQLNYLFFLVFILVSCNSSKRNNSEADISVPIKMNIENFVLEMPDVPHRGTLILFGGYPEGPEDIKREFGILGMAKQLGLAVLYMKFNQRLWLRAEEKTVLTNILDSVFTN